MAVKLQSAAVVKTKLLTVAWVLATGCELPPELATTEVTLEFQHSVSKSVAVTLSTTGDCAWFDGVTVEIDGIAAAAVDTGGWRFGTKCQSASFSIWGATGRALLERGIEQVTIKTPTSSKTISVPRRRCVPVSMMPTATPVKARIGQPFSLRYEPADAYEPFFTGFGASRAEDGVVELTSEPATSPGVKQLQPDSVLVVEPITCEGFAGCELFCHVTEIGERAPLEVELTQ